MHKEMKLYSFFLQDTFVSSWYTSESPTYPVSWQAWLLSWHPPSQSLYLYVPGPGPQAEGEDKPEGEQTEDRKMAENIMG